MAIEEKFLEAIKKLRETEKKRNFDQTVDLVINLKNFDVRRESFNLFIEVPHKIKEKKIAGFLENKSKIIETIKKEEFAKYKEKKDLRKLKKFDFFIANAKLMPTIATSFGRILGSSGKMPSPQLGIIANEDENSIKNAIEKINSTIRVRVKEPSLKLAIAKESMKDKEITENAIALYNKILEKLPKKNENIKNILIKFSMGKPQKITV